ncbi:MAG: DUF5343 domain-containing protein [Polyangia bacterium]
MADFPYSPHSAKLKQFLDHVQKAGVPEKVTMKYLETVGFKSTNDRYILAILKFLGFVDASGSPTKTWTDYRNRQIASATLAAAMRRAYQDLFKTYPDADRKDSEALRNYFSAHSKVAESTLGLIVATFKALAAIADFDAVPAAEGPESAEDPVLPARRRPPSPARGESDARPTTSSAPTININIQLQLPATEDAGIYDKLFAALKKHLFS